MIISFDDPVDSLMINESLVIKLKDQNINYVKDLWQKKRINLKEMKFNDAEINQIIIKMQLHGIDLNKKIY